MKKFFKKYKIYLVIFILLLVLGGIVYSLKTFLYPDDLKSVYGNRLNGIEDVKISADRISALTNQIKENEAIDTVKVEIKGKIINVIIGGSLTIEESEELLNGTLESFSEEEIAYYDFQFFATNEELKYKLIGYKNKTTESTVWTEVSEVDENEEEE